MTHRYDVIVVGGGVAGVNAAVEAKSVRPSSSVALVADEDTVYPRPSLTLAISGLVKSVDDVSIFSRDSLKAFGVKPFFSRRAISLDSDNRAMTLGDSGREKSFGYRKLVLATGSLPAVPSIPGLDLNGVFSIKWMEDALRLSSFARSGMKACVDGAGFAGLEVAQALSQRGLKVTLAVRSRILSQLLEPELSSRVKEQVERFGLEVSMGSLLESIHGKNRVKYVSLNDRRLRTDLVVFATGVRPNVELAVGAGLKLGDTGAIATDNNLRTNIESIYAAGDCAETLDLLTGKGLYRPLGTVAARSGETAGSNAAGKRREYRGYLRRQYARIFGIEIVSMGLSTKQATAQGIEAEVVPIEVPYASNPVLSILRPSEVLLNAVIEKRSQRIIGWQAIGKPMRTSWYSQFLEGLIERGEKLSSIQDLGLRVRQNENAERKM